MTAAPSAAPGWRRPYLPLALGAVVAGRRRCGATTNGCSAPAALGDVVALPRLTLLDGGTPSAADLLSLAEWAHAA